MPTTRVSAFGRVRGRYLVITWILLVFYTPAVELILGEIGYSWPWYWWDLAYIYEGHAIFAVALAATLYFGGVSFKEILGRDATAADYVSGIKLTAYIFIFSTAAAYALFVPLSYVVPRFVEYWYIDLPDLIYFDSGRFPLLPNLLNLFALCVITPALEEFAFRGLLLHRWAEKYGLRTAIISSSALFSILHPDPIGAFVFGVGMCILYLKTQSLILPITCHALNNFAVWLIELGYVVVEGPEYDYTLERFLAEWYVGVAAGAVCLVWSIVYLRGEKSAIEWKLPVT